ncbi:MAG: hypothetical protein V5A45_04615 [Haloarculaceae archaeon]
MENIKLTIPKSIVDSLPEDSAETKQDMEKAIIGWERNINASLEAQADEEMIDAIVDLIEHFESRWESYDDYVVELRAWGQSPIYAMAWRDLHAAVIQQVHEHEDLSDRINRERHARIFNDGIRPGSN